jgi:hypothetical protein
MGGTGVHSADPASPGVTDMPPIKKIVLWLLVIFLLYAIFVSPNEAASLVGTVWDIIVNGVKNVAKFFDALLSR